MSSTKTDILVYAHWLGMLEPKCIGVLSSQQAKGKKAFSFAYNEDWINSKEQVLLDPDITWFSGSNILKIKKTLEYLWILCQTPGVGH